MRVTSNTYTDLVINSSQNSQQKLAVLQQQISTGNTVEFASDDPIAFQQAAQTQSNISKLNGYSDAAFNANNQVTQNNQAMTNLHQLVARAGEIATSVSTKTNASDLKNYGTEMDSLITQLTSIANQKYNGNYLFGGTNNQPPITASTNTYNASANGVTTTTLVQDNNSVQTGIVAGRSGTPAVDGFLYDSTTGVDVLASLIQARNDLNSGNGSAVINTDLPALNKALDHISLYVGKTSADLSAVNNASQITQQLLTAQHNQLNGLTQTNLPNTTLQLQQIQTQYQATLQAGSRIMGISILNYFGSIPNG